MPPLLPPPPLDEADLVGSAAFTEGDADVALRVDAERVLLPLLLPPLPVPFEPQALTSARRQNFSRQHEFDRRWGEGGSGSIQPMRTRGVCTYRSIIIIFIVVILKPFFKKIKEGGATKSQKQSSGHKHNCQGQKYKHTRAGDRLISERRQVRWCTAFSKKPMRTSANTNISASGIAKSSTVVSMTHPLRFGLTRAH